MRQVFSWTLTAATATYRATDIGAESATLVRRDFEETKLEGNSPNVDAKGGRDRIEHKAVHVSECKCKDAGRLRHPTA